MKGDKNSSSSETDPHATGQGQAPEDASGITGGKYADPDGNAAFHPTDEEIVERDQEVAELPEHTAYEPDTTPVGGHVPL